MRAAQHGAERRARKEQRTDEEQERAQDRRSRDADRDPDGAAEHLPEVAALIAAEGDHEPEGEDDETGAEGAHVDERAARDHEGAERDEEHRQHP